MRRRRPGGAMGRSVAGPEVAAQGCYEACPDCSTSPIVTLSPYYTFGRLAIPTNPIRSEPKKWRAGGRGTTAKGHKSWARRKPTPVAVSKVGTLPRAAERSSNGPFIQEPPRTTRRRQLPSSSSCQAEPSSGRCCPSYESCQQS